MKNIQICQLFGTFQIVITLSLFNKLKQIERIARNEKFSSLKFYSIRQIDKQLLQLIKNTDQTYGMMMSIFLLINYPTNAYLIMIFFIKKISIMNKIIFITIIIYQFSFIFLFHLIATRYAYHIHRPVKYIIIDYFSQSPISLLLNNRLKISLWIEKFHTKKFYGITYGGIEVITLKTFFKVK